MITGFNPKAAEALCTALGLDPKHVQGLVLTLEAPGGFSLKVDYIVPVPELGEVAHVLSEYDVKLEKRVL